MSKYAREYFETGCLCILTGPVPKQSVKVSDQFAAMYYLTSCKCSRHPESHNRDVELERIMRKELGLK